MRLRSDDVARSLLLSRFPYHGSQTRADIKLGPGLFLAVSRPTRILGFTPYRGDRSFAVLGQNRKFVLTMAARSIVGSFAGDRLLGLIPWPVVLAIMLVLLAVKVWRHK
jgi:uncharacterized protein